MVGEGHPPAVFLADGQPAGYHDMLIEVRVSESVVLAYEWPEQGSALRNFYVPATVVNGRRISKPGLAGSSPAGRAIS